MLKVTIRFFFGTLEDSANYNNGENWKNRVEGVENTESFLKSSILAPKWIFQLGRDRSLELKTGLKSRHINLGAMSSRDLFKAIHLYETL